MAGIVLYTDICLIVLLIASIAGGLFRLRRGVDRENLIALQFSRPWAFVRAGCSAAAALVVFIMALAVHEASVELQGVPVFCGPSSARCRRARGI